jgi:hypothetical protein
MSAEHIHMMNNGYILWNARDFCLPFYALEWVQGYHNQTHSKVEVEIAYTQPC